MAGLLDNIDLNDPKTLGLLNLGIGILAGNTGRPGDLGQGIMGGFQNYQQMMAQQQRQKMQEQQLAQDHEMFGLKKTQMERENSKPLVVGKTLIDPVTYKPLYEGSAASGVDPYYTPIPTEHGLGSFDNRSGKFQIIAGPNGQPIVKSADSPTVRGAVKGAEAQAAANWKPSDMIEGQVLTEAQIANMARGMPNFNTPYPVTFGAPGTTATDRQEGTTGDIPLRSPFNQRPGIRVPTKAEQAAAEKEAVIKAESGAKKESTMSGIGDIINEARTVLSGDVKPTSSGFGAVIDNIGGALGYSPEGAKESDRLKAIGGALVAKMPRMEGPQSNFDVENYKIMAGDVGNPAIPIDRRLAALDQVEKLWRKYDKTSAPATQQKPRSKADILKQYGVR